MDPTSPHYVDEQYGDVGRLRVRLEAHRLFSERTTDTLQSWVVGLMQPRRGSLVVDIGCGVGTYHPLLAGLAARIISLDLSIHMLEATLSQANELAIRVETVRASAERIPLVDGCCDIAMCNHVLYHVRDILAALTELRRIVRPGGSVAITTNVRGRVPADRFTIDDLPLVKTVFPTAQLHIREDAFRFPSLEDAMKFFETTSRAHELQPHVELAIRREGVFRWDKTAGCFLARL